MSEYSYHYGLPKHINAMVQVFDTHEVVLIRHIYISIDALPYKVLLTSLEKNDCMRKVTYKAMQLVKDGELNDISSVLVWNRECLVVHRSGFPSGNPCNANCKILGYLYPQYWSFVQS